MPLIFDNKYIDELIMDGVNVKEVILNGVQIDKKCKVTIKAKQFHMNNNYTTRALNILIPHYTAAGAVTYTTSQITMGATEQNFEFWVRKGQSLKLDFSPWRLSGGMPNTVSQYYLKYGYSEMLGDYTYQSTKIKSGSGTKLVLATNAINSDTVINVESQFITFQGQSFVDATVSLRVGEHPYMSTSFFSKDSTSSSDATWS